MPAMVAFAWALTCARYGAAKGLEHGIRPAWETTALGPVKEMATMLAP